MGALAGAAETAMVVGHNPGLEDCAAALLARKADAEERAGRDEMGGKFPTGTLAVIDHHQFLIAHADDDFRRDAGFGAGRHLNDERGKKSEQAKAGAVKH